MSEPAVVATTTSQQGGKSVDDFTYPDGSTIPHKSPENIRRALRKLGIRIRFDAFSWQPTIEGLPGYGPILDDHALNKLRIMCEDKFSLAIGKDKFFCVVSDIAQDNKYNPVLDYFSRLKWDRKPRAETWLIHYGGAEDNPYVRRIGAILLMAIVRRAKQPGCKFDEMVILVSPTQGTEKSSAWEVMAIEKRWFLDKFSLDLSTKEAMEQTEGKLIIESAELEGMSKAGRGRLKAFLSSTVDKARMSYGRLSSERPRQLVIVGSTNDPEWGQDETGSRREWSVGIKRFDIAALRKDRDQLYAEAVVREAMPGETIRLEPALWPAAEAEQNSRLLSVGLQGIEWVILRDHSGGKACG